MRLAKALCLEQSQFRSFAPRSGAELCLTTGCYSSHFAKQSGQIPWLNIASECAEM